MKKIMHHLLIIVALLLAAQEGSAQWTGYYMPNTDTVYVGLDSPVTLRLDFSGTGVTADPGNPGIVNTITIVLPTDGFLQYSGNNSTTTPFFLGSDTYFEWLYEPVDPIYNAPSLVGTLVQSIPMGTTVDLPVPVTGGVAGTSNEVFHTDIFFSAVTPNFSQPEYQGSFVVMNNPLPVSFVSISAAPVNNSRISINWVTASEQNNRGFDIESSDNGQTFRKIGYVASLADHGNSSSSLKYDFIDMAPVKGVSNYYRLKQIDVDGRTTYSKVVSAFISTENTPVSIYPNPADNKINVAGGEINAPYRIININGQTLSKGTSAGSIDISLLIPGVYFLNISSPTGTNAVVPFVKK